MRPCIATRGLICWLVSRSHGRSVGWSVSHAFVKISENGFLQILNDLNSTILIQILERVIWRKKRGGGGGEIIINYIIII